MGLLLRAVEVAGRHRWRWLLEDAESGAPLADHQVALNPAARGVRAFEDLPRFLRWRADPDRRVESEAHLLTQVGAWLGTRVLGEQVGARIAERAPVTVRVRVPPGAEFLLVWPLELAHVDGVPLAARGDVSLVYEVEPPARRKLPVGERLRMLAVFSLPTESTALGLRRERYELARLVRRLAARRGLAVDLEVLQYGVTRQRLARALAAGGGPEVLHISGHGSAGGLLLERADGSTDLVSAEELLGLLRPARERVRLAVVSACESAAARVAQTLGLLGLAEAAAQAEQQAQAETPPAPGMGIAHRVARELDCAVVAMRYPVADEFAIALAGQLYEGVFELDLPLDRALPRAVAGALAGGPSPARPAISVAVPTLVGGRAAGLSLRPPAGDPQLDPAKVRMAAFPPEPSRFVGRARVMAAASAALAPDSGRSGVLFHGMAGAGKTACALELAYRHATGFAGGLVFWQAPARADEFGGALVSLATSLEQQWGGHGFAMVDKIATLAGLRAFLPRLSALLAEQGLLLVLDNLETLLTDEGTWRDPRWAELVAALTGHDGESRVVLTSRVRPADLDQRMLVEPVHALSRDESALLARELPNLRRLLHTEPSPTRADVEVTSDRAVVAEVLELVQGHPKLLELADAAAADRAALATHLAAAQAAAEAYGAALPAFFARGESDLDAAGFVNVLTAWTRSTLATLPDDARLLFELLCLVEQPDRHRVVIAGTWADLWRRLDRPGDPPDPATLMPALAGTALVDVEGDGYRVHPGVADAVRTTAPAGLRTTVDTALAAWWRAVAEHATAGKAGEHGQAVVRAGLAAAPYLLRLGDWDAAGLMLEWALLRDASPATTQATLPHLRRIADTTGAIHHTGLLATTLAQVDPAGAEQLLRDVLDRAVAAEDFQTASTAGGELINLLRDAGRLREALTVLDQKAEHTRRAGLGPWTQLIDRSWRLQIRRLLGESEPVLAEVEALREEMDRLPDPPGPDETVDPWHVREMILNTGVLAARDLGRWQQALDLNAEVRASQRHRRVGSHELARARFNDYVPLLRLGHLDRAEALLRECQQVFEDQQDIPWLGTVLDARADVAAERGHADEAAAHESAALRLKYLRPNPHDVAVSHHNLADHLRRSRTDSADRVAQQVAAALIHRLTGAPGPLTQSVRGLAHDLRTLGDQAGLPGSVAELAARVDQVEGVRFTALIDRLAPDPQTAETALAEIIQAARELPAEQVYDVQGQLQRWQPAIDELVAAARGDEEAAADVDDLLDHLAITDDWQALAGVLRQILAGERDREALLAGLHPVDTAIVRATLDRLTTDPHDPDPTKPANPAVAEGPAHHGD